MKYYSEVLNKPFDTEEECVNAEKTYAEEQKKKETTKTEISKRKKELSNLIELAETELEKAYTDYDLAKDKAAKILEESNAEVNKILHDASAKVKAAQVAKRDAVINFTTEFGTYSKTITGDAVERELQKTLRHFPTFGTLIDNFLDIFD